MVTLFEEVAAERIRQNEKHPVNPKFVSVHTDYLSRELTNLREFNDRLEYLGVHDYYRIIQEELIEVVLAETREERHAEIVQAIALLVRLDEDTEI